MTIIGIFDILAILEYNLKVMKKSSQPEIVIDVKNLVKCYNKSKTNAVDDVSFSVKKGEFFTLLGPNGAGKTTTISILTTILSKTSGQATVVGYDLDKEANKVRKNVGIIFQKPSLDENLTAEENIRFHTVLYGYYDFRPTFSLMPAEYQTKVQELSSLLEIENDLNLPIKKFSGGMKRKLEIIRSLMHDPKILFLDEPTTGLDPQSRKNLWEYLQQVRAERNMTIFLTTHYLDEAEGADRVCIINHGKIVEDGSPRDIKRKLLTQYMILDSDKPKVLEGELKKMSIKYTGKGPFRIIAQDAQAQKIIQSIKVPLTELQVIQPTLEDAYISIIGKQENHEK